MKNKLLSTKIRLNDILLAIKSIETYMDGVSKEQFDMNFEKQDAVIRRIEIIGEASAQIPNEFRMKHPDIPWKKMIGMRNIAIHEYESVDTDIIWETATKRIFEIRDDIKRMKKVLND